MAALVPTSRMRCMYIFNRNGVCLHYHVWMRPHTTLSQQQDQKLMFGLLFSLKSFTAKMDPVGWVFVSLSSLPFSRCRCVVSSSDLDCVLAICSAAVTRVTSGCRACLDKGVRFTAFAPTPTSSASWNRRPVLR